MLKKTAWGLEGYNVEKEMVINALEPEENRVAILEDKVLEWIHIERVSKEKVAGNIYKGVVTAVESAFQAAFIDIGLEKSGFLHVSDVKGSESLEKGFFRRRAKDDRRRIETVLKKGDEVVVQVTKEGFGTKGHTVTSYLGIPGRYLVSIPDSTKRGVSRKIEDRDERERLRNVLAEMDVPSNMGLILRTVGVGRDKKDFEGDLDYLMRLWHTINRRIKKMPVPSMVYQESDLITRMIRDTYSPDISRLVVDSPEVKDKIVDFLKSIESNSETSVELYTDPEPIFHKYGIEEEIEKIYIKRVPLRRGGYLIIEPTEAMVTIDVNSGRYTKGSNVEETAYGTNMDAAPEVARQIRLRNLGGLIVVDFIDMFQDKNRKKVQSVFEDALSRDRARIKVLRMSYLGLVELTRQRVVESLESTVYEDCPNCSGKGLIKTLESTCLSALRQMRSAASKENVKKVEVLVHPRVATHLQNVKRSDIADLEDTYHKEILIRSVPEMNPDEIRFEVYGKDNRKVSL